MHKKKLGNLINEYHKSKGFFRAFAHASHLGGSVSTGIEQLIQIYNKLSDLADNQEIPSTITEELKRVIVNYFVDSAKKNQNPYDPSILTNSIFIKLARELENPQYTIVPPTTILEQDFKEEKMDAIVFRGDDRDPKEIFENGFNLKPSRAALKPVKGLFEAGSAISFSSNILASPAFPINEKKDIYIYIVNIDQGFDLYKHGLLAMKESDITNKNFLKMWPKEFATRNPITSENIAGCLKIHREPGPFGIFMDGQFEIKELIINEYADPTVIKKVCDMYSIQNFNELPHKLSGDHMLPINGEHGEGLEEYFKEFFRKKLG